MSINGILNINKPVGPTSFRIVESVRRLCGENRVGHAGTLDPAASGVLPVCLGQAVRLTEYIHNFSKEYIAGIMLGATTDTLDAQGSLISRGYADDITEDRALQAIKGFIGEISQVPPAYSASKIGGKKAYRLARKGALPPLGPRRVTIYAIDVLSFKTPYLKVRVHCSTGTYIRALARDLGIALGCGAYLQDLVRTIYGPYRLEEALSPDELAAAVMAGNIENALYPIDHPLQSWPKQTLDERDSAHVLSGTAIYISSPSADTGQMLRCYDSSGKFLAILKFAAENGLWWPQKVFNL